MNPVEAVFENPRRKREKEGGEVRRTDVFAGNEHRHLNILTRLSRDSRKSSRYPPDDSLKFARNIRT